MNLIEAKEIINNTQNQLHSLFIKINSLLKDYIFITENYMTEWGYFIFNNYFIDWDGFYIHIFIIKNKYLKKIKDIFQKVNKYINGKCIGLISKEGQYHGDIGEIVIILNALNNHLLNKDYALERNLRMAEYIKICMNL